MSAEARTAEECAAEAASRGCVVVYPKPNELFIDIDTEQQRTQFKICFNILLKIAAYTGSKCIERPSPSGKSGRYHITVTLPGPVDELERIMLQAMLGSDPLREILSYARLVAGDPRPVCFFEKPQKKAVR